MKKIFIYLICSSFFSLQTLMQKNGPDMVKQKKTNNNLTSFFGWISFLSSFLILLYFIVIYANGYPWSIILNVIFKLSIIPIVCFLLFLYHNKKGAK